MPRGRRSRLRCGWRRRGRGVGVHDVKAQGRVRDLDDVLPFRGNDRDIRRHARLQFQVQIGDRNDHVISHDVLHGDGRVAILHDLALKGPIGKGVNGEIHVLFDFDIADVGLGHVGVDLHPRQVVRDKEEHRRIHRRGHGLADIDVARDDDAIDGRVDRAVLQVDVGQFEIGVLHLHGGLGLVKRGDGGIEIGLRRGVLVDQLLFALGRQLRQFQRRPGIGQVALALVHVGQVDRRVDLGHDLVGFDLRIPVREELLDIPGNLAAHGHVEHWVQGAGGSHDLRDIALGHRRRDVLHLFAVRAFVVHQPP